MRTKKTKTLFGSMVAIILAIVCVLMVGCSTPEPPDKDDDNGGGEKVAVTEITLELSKSTVRIGESVTAEIRIRPSNATDKTYSLSSSDNTIATVDTDGVTINTLSRGSVIITARSKSDVTKKAEATLVVLGSDENGRYENLYEAEDSNIIASSGSGIKIENSVDDRISGTGVVGSISKGDKLVWGVNSSDVDSEAVLKFRLMGPSGWVGLWDSISYKFADWYTVKVNGRTVDTESILVEGTKNKGNSADYYAVKDITLGNISLVKGLNVITFVVSNRYDQTKVNDGTYNGTISCWGNIDSMTILSSKDLSYVADTVEVENPDPDVSSKTLKMEVEASTTRIYENEQNPDVQLTGNYVEFKAGMNVLFGINSDSAMRAKFSFKIASPYVDANTLMQDVNLADMVSVNIGGKNVSLSGMVVKGNDVKGSKENYTEVKTDWIDLAEGENTLGIVVKSNSTYAYLGGLDSISLIYFEGGATAFKVDQPRAQKTVRLEAEADTTKLVGYEALQSGASYVEFKNAYKVQEDVYNNKVETTKIIFGVEADAKTFATIKMRVASPYINSTTAMQDVSIGSLGDLWVNGTIISTPNILKGNSAVNTKENFTEIEVEIQVELSEGKNRIAWEPYNYTSNNYEYFGALDYIEVVSVAEVTPYLVNFWTDRYTYYDDDNNEPIYVTCDKVASTSCWLALYRAEDSVEVNQPGSLFWYYPTNGSWNSDGVNHLGDAVNILAQNPNKERPLINATTGGYYKVVYFESDTKNAQNGYNIVDVVYISVWNDPDNYGGRK